MAKGNTAIYIPAFNAEKTLPAVLNRIPKDVVRSVKEIFVVDNCSSDNTSEVVLRYKEKFGIDNLNLIRNETNLGYGGSQKVAYE